MDTFSKKFVVKEEHTAKNAGSGDLDVLATPVMIAMVENTAKDFLGKELADEETSVGTSINVKHLHPSKVGTEITVTVKCTEQEKNKIGFSFEVMDEDKLVATGEHYRAVILTEIFLSKLG
ncbi:thioesterase family protein [Enterococcus sp. BWB1-3]|uniref:thioesterase family protein n=1 Tax=Enterococcus sp. BWB1-3 TaxID=2787713 RepID=UPI0019250A25|nr:thioesterase family protein [Enterococcus sp. BWB1-3]MBL1230826.1 thioesterase family protein [Enterococcus sp. BWB1-3]